MTISTMKKLAINIKGMVDWWINDKSTPDDFLFTTN